jgi:hypothetical protein
MASGSLVLLEEMAGVWPLGPSEMTTLREGSTSVPRPKGPRGSLTLLGGGGDASEQRVACSEASVAAPEVGTVGKSSSREIPLPLPQRSKEAVIAAGGRHPAHDALVSHDLGSSTTEVSVALPSPLPPPPQRQEPGAGAATAVITVTKKRKMAFPKSRYVQRGNFVFFYGSSLFS